MSTSYVNSFIKKKETHSWKSYYNKAYNYEFCLNISKIVTRKHSNDEKDKNDLHLMIKQRKNNANEHTTWIPR